MSDTPGYTYLRETDFATKLTPGRGMPDVSSTPEDVYLWHLAKRTLLVDTLAGVICKADGVTRAERAKSTAYGIVYLGRFGGRVKWFYAHRGVWIAAHGRIPGTYQINHRNGHRWDNRLENLDMVTPGDNVRHYHRLPYEHVPGVPFLGPDDRPEIQLIPSGPFTPHRKNEMY